jgi:hypothetical protein
MTIIVPPDFEFVMMSPKVIGVRHNGGFFMYTKERLIQTIEDEKDAAARFGIRDEGAHNEFIEFYTRALAYFEAHS